MTSKVRFFACFPFLLILFSEERNEIGSIHLVWLTPYCDDQLSVPKSDQEICEHRTVNDT